MQSSRHITIPLALAALTLAAGCGGSSSTRPARATGTDAATSSSRTAAATAPAAPMYLFFKRSMGVDPLASQLTVYADGTAVAVITNGGIDGAVTHTFHLSASQLHHLRDLAGGTRLRNTSCCNTELYTYWLTVGNQSARLQQGIVPSGERPLIADLNAITDAHTNF